MALPTFSALSDGERDWIAQQLESARLFVAAMSPADQGSFVTLEALDRAWTTWLAQAENDNVKVNLAINAVGVQFGQTLVDQAGFDWIIAADAQGTELAVLALPGSGDVLVYPANFVAKRWQNGEVGFLAPSFATIRKQVVGLSHGTSIARRPWWNFWSK